MSQLITTTSNTGNNFMFDTTRFIDVTTRRQASNGTQMFLDTSNPGVYYTSHLSGYVRRIITTQTHYTDLMTGKTYSANSDINYQINRRCNTNSGNGITSVLLPRLNDRLSRIQEMANKYDREIETVSSGSGNHCVMVSPRLR